MVQVKAEPSPVDEDKALAKKFKPLVPIIIGADEAENENTKQSSKSANDYTETTDDYDDTDPDYSANNSSDEDFTSSSQSSSD